MSRPIRISVTVAVVVLLLAPVLLDRDGFPLSTYPMYARTRGDVVGFVTAYGIDPAGRRHELSLAQVGDSDDPLVVAGELRAEIRGGRADRRCVEIAARLRDGESFRSVEIVTERYDVVARITSGDGPIDRAVHAVCSSRTDS